MNCQAILFDLDGVLIDACEWHYMALNKALKIHGLPEINRTDHETIYNGLPTFVKLKMLNVPDEQANTINQTKQDLTLQIIRNNANILNEKIQLHEWLKQNNIKIACVTNSIRQTAIEMLKKTGQIDYMDVLIANEDVIRNKPYPDCYNLAIEKLNVNPKYSLCVEDSDKGIKAATDSVVKHLLIVKNTHDVNLNNIKRKVEQI